ncbi:NAD(+) diphosphatase [Actinopolymorpha alba]|uniref:NAD(+) diphosphatase n=1 Tax=Actinopolymorpha alba TaxID=533267 RepID=UPI001ED9A9EE|nr:NAD(+) diphosphatase [Actinopolymorpha alba]
MPRLSQLALARSTLDRATERRANAAWVAERWSDPRCRVLVIVDGKAPASEDGSALVYVSPASVEAAGAPSDERYLLGLDTDGVPYFAVHGTGEADGEGQDGRRLIGLREAGGLVSDRDAGVFVHAMALVNWHAAHPRCARCGTATEPTDGGHVRRCPSCGTQHFPRTDPAIIVLVSDDADRCLLGRQPSWPTGRFSTLAGFVEPGEPLEHAVVREVREETGIEVVDPVYAGSQPWPFPSSLMLGFFARAVTTEIKVDEEEIAEARWLSRAELRAAVESGELLLPGRVSIARRLIEAWYGEELPGDW